MACVVEMSWGEPQRGILIERDDGGEITDVRVLRRRAAPDPGRRTFHCSGQVWYDTLDLARKHGWRPSGAVPAAEAVDAWVKEAKPDPGFEPRLRPYVKQCRMEDALRLVDALERALGDPVELAMLRIALNAAREEAYAAVAAFRGRPLSSDFLRDFISFLRKGPFVFAWRGL
jgi:hypothetical protein